MLNNVKWGGGALNAFTYVKQCVALRRFFSIITMG